MPVITLASGKGGVGKTLVAISLAAALAAEGYGCRALLDADPNRGAHRWATETYGSCQPLQGLCRGSYRTPGRSGARRWSSAIRS